MAVTTAALIPLPAAERVTPETVADARRLLGARLADTRRAAGVRQVGLARMVRWSRSTVANVETGRQSTPREFWLACDLALGAGGLLVAGWAETNALSSRLRDQIAMERIRLRLSESPPRCVCRDLQRLLSEVAASAQPGPPTTGNPDHRHQRDSPPGTATTRADPAESVKGDTRRG
ncbi:helix-turn-helix domain-containing protein [Micromonospora fluostatini]|uniref:helix-turn-helix domain-containing protein n=1 Tax=Micromonospora sp. JCM 30529 TaxID=3421643 RepID=UPI003D16CE94